MKPELNRDDGIETTTCACDKVIEVAGTVSDRDANNCHDDEAVVNSGSSVCENI
jgi:hypothetical protein